jgi:PAS domain S-box-containing protein
MSFLRWLGDSQALTPHGFCLFWEPGLLWLNAGSDTATALAYFSIPLAILWFVRRRPDLAHAEVALLFVAFIMACGATHAMSILTLWVPAYHLEAAVKLVTAILSVVTAAALWPLVPKLLRVPSLARMEELTEELRATIDHQDETARTLEDSEQRLRLAHADLQRVNDDLEQRISDRTAELNRLYESLTRNEARLRQVIEAAPSGIITIDRTGAIAMVNTQTERLFGYARAEMIGRPIEMLLPEGARAGHPALRAHFFRESRSRAMGAGSILHGLRKDGGEFPVEIGISPIDTDEGPMVLAAIMDVSARTKLENDLRQSQKMEVIGRLASGVAHDFNNLLQSITASLEIVQDSLQAGTQPYEFAEIGLRSARRGSYLTHHLLSYARQQMLRPRLIDLPVLLSDLGKMLGRTLGPFIQITIRADPAAPLVTADPGQLNTALLNLAINASHAMPNGGALHIESRATTIDGAPMVSVAVIDTGTGMDPATLARATEPFFTTKGLGGTGLGLSMVHGFAEQSGGGMHIRSTPGQGTTVELLLPAAASGAAPHAQPPPGATRGGTVLLVDDDKDVLATTGAVLLLAGFNVIHAGNAAEALARLDGTTAIDIMVTDFAMPGMNGAELLIEARRRRPMPGIVITGYAAALETAPLREDMPTLRKPFERRDLIDAIRAELSRAAPDHAAAADTGAAAAP